MAKATCEYCDKVLTGRQTRFCCKRHARCVHMREASGSNWSVSTHFDPQ